MSQSFLLFRSKRLRAQALPRLIAMLLLGILSMVCRMTQAHATGLLVPTDGSLAPLAIRSHRVTVNVHERVAETRVVQVFRNNTDRQLEATYIFPVPQGASVSGFAMTVNGVRQEGVVLEAAEARRVYEGIVARLQDPGLVEHMGGNLFRARVFPIPPRGDQTVELRFTSTLDYQAGTLHYRYPLRTTGQQAQTLEDFTLSATMDSRVPIRAVYSPSHRVDTTRRNDHHVTVGFGEGRAALDRDFDLYFTVADGDVGLSVLSHHPEGEDGYFLMMVSPRTEVTESEIIGKDIVFVCDTSGSMAGEKMQHARDALRAWIERLNPDDTFNILRFSTDVEQLSEAPLSASADNRARALRFVSTFEASGGTAIAPVLTQALSIPVRRGAPRTVVFLTDGMPTVGETNVQQIIQSVHDRNGSVAQIFAFGLGDDVNTTFLDLLAQQNRGGADYARSGAEMSTLLTGFYNMIAFPVLADLRLALRGADAYDVYPRDLGTLYRGGQLVVTGRYRTPGNATVALTATVAHQQEPRTFDWPVTLPAHAEDNSFIPRVWATRKTGYLLDEIRLRGENPELRDSVVQLARRFGIVTPYTSYLVTETPQVAVPSDEESRNGNVDGDSDGVANRPMRRPVSLPTGFAVPDSVGRPRTRDRRVPTEVVAAQPSPPRPQSGSDFEAFQSLGGGASNMMRPAAPSPSVVQGTSTSTPVGLNVGHSQTMATPSPVRPSVDATGEAGRRVATTLRSMREAQQANTGTGNSRFVAGRAMVLRDNMWVDQSITGTPRELHIRSLSRSYFTLARLRPNLRALLSLGNAVRFRLDANRVIVVSPNQNDTSDADIEAFLR
jgi:Ca-activated chloride channel homolog